MLLAIIPRVKLACHGAGTDKNHLAGTQPWVCGDAGHMASPHKPCKVDPKRDAGGGTAWGMERVVNHDGFKHL